MKRLITILLTLQLSACMSMYDYNHISQICKQTIDEQIDIMSQPHIFSVYTSDHLGTILTDSDTVIIGDDIYLNVVTNTLAIGEKLTIDLESQSCEYNLTNDNYLIENGVIDDVLINGKSHQCANGQERIHTQLKLISVKATSDCLE